MQKKSHTITGAGLSDPSIRNQPIEIQKKKILVLFIF